MTATKNTTGGQRTANVTITTTAGSPVLTRTITVTQLACSTNGGGSNEPAGVTGRELSGSKIGDSSDWVEVAQVAAGGNSYSLIVRKANLPSFVAFDPRPSGYTNIYSSSDVRNAINNWFNGDSIAATAALRKYTVKPSLPAGTFGAKALGTDGYGTFDGFSTPGTTITGTGNDVAFILSYGEYARFCSLNWMNDPHHISANNPPNRPSHPTAVSNYHKLSLAGSDTWSRSSDRQENHVGYLSKGGLLFTTASIWTLAARPALWVKSEIFNL